ncbi:hypothetical protein OpiT1DRAFT_01962 [Opitutaceae bacterium TAV1]|nr:hypothetical protein OpiT1DRAFT_01962 [Opitutaceae bacterium TAV1]
MHCHRLAAIVLSLPLLLIIAPSALASDAPRWETVARTDGNLAFVRDLTAWALAAPAKELANAFALTDALPQERRDLARSLLLIALVERAPDAAIALRKRAGDQWTPSEIARYYLAFANHSPAKALALLADEPSNAPASRDALLSRLAQQLAQTDWLALRRLADATADPDIRAALDRAASETLAWQPPATLLAHVKATGWDGFPEHALRPLLEHAATLPADEASALFQTVPPRLLQTEHETLNLCELWTPLAPAAALDWARNLPDADLRERALLRANTMLCETDPALAFDQIAQTPPGPLQAKLTRNTLLALSKKDLPAAIDWTLALPEGALRDQAAEAIAIQAARTHPGILASRLLELPEGNARARLVAAFAPRWLDFDVAAASAWLLALPPGPERHAALAPAFSALAEQAPDDAIRLAQTLADPAERADLIRRLAKMQTATHPDEILALIATLPDSREKQRTLDSALAQLAKEEPDTMTALIESGAIGIPSANVLNDLLQARLKAASGDTWRETTAVTAAWFDRLLATNDPDVADLGPRIVGNFVSTWAEIDPEAAAAWIGNLPPGKTRASAASALVVRLAWAFPARALAHAAAFNIPDSSLRDTIRSIARAHPGQINTLIRASALSDAQKTNALKWSAQ